MTQSRGVGETQRQTDMVPKR